MVGPGMDPGEPTPDSLVQGDDGSSDGNSWFSVLFMLVVAALIGLALWYVMYGMGPV